MTKGNKVSDWTNYQCKECFKLVYEMDLKVTDWEEKGRDEEQSVCPNCRGEVELYEPVSSCEYDTLEEREGDR